MYSNLEDLLRRGIIDEDRINREGHKTLVDLRKELLETEVVIMEVFRNGVLRAARFAMSSRVLIMCGNAQLVEVARTYHRTGQTVYNRKDHTVSETRKRDMEDDEKCAIRGLREELKFEVPPDKKLVRLSNLPISYEHESTVYPGLLSMGYRTDFALTLEERIYPDGVTFSDVGNDVHLQWEIV